MRRRRLISTQPAPRLLPSATAPCVAVVGQRQKLLASRTALRQPIDLILRESTCYCRDDLRSWMAIPPAQRDHEKPEGFQSRVGERVRRREAEERRDRSNLWPHFSGHRVASGDGNHSAFKIVEQWGCRMCHIDLPSPGAVLEWGPCWSPQWRRTPGAFRGRRQPPACDMSRP